MKPLKLIYILLFLSLSVSADCELFDAYEKFVKPSTEQFTRRIHYEFKANDSEDDTAGTLSYISKGESRFSLSFSVGLLKLHLTRDQDRIQLYTPHNKTLFMSSCGENAFSLKSLMSCLHSMDESLGQDISSLCSLEELQNKKDFVIQKNESIYYLYLDGYMLAEITLKKSHLDEAKIFFKTGVMNLEFESSNYGSLIYRNSRAKKIVRPKSVDMDRSLTRSLARYLQIRHYEIFKPEKKEKYLKGKYGKLKRLHGMNYVYLKGSAYEIGWQHGKFLAEESRRVVDSTLYLMGMVYSIKTGDWFMDRIREAQASLDKHTPQEYIEELKGLAEGSQIPIEEIHLANYFPALFHCSGFTVKDDKTLNGIMYHGRVLDYMCRIGLQYDNAIFTVEKIGAIPFVNIGFAGFIGSVSGMNQEKISLGEMGGRGEGLWDGVPMPILMRMTLERASNLNEAKEIFSSNPRTCEYYYIFADGNDRSSTAVYAKPESIEFLDPGKNHKKLPHKVPSCLMIASGSRYESLHNSVKKSSLIDEEKAIDLMNAPTASMDNNLHSVLFIPENLKLWFSYAGVYNGAYDEEFVDLHLSDLLKEEFYKKPQ
ncbi:C45 family autoproteolytic acyltransferase/hydrolase [Lentisphaera marina]|uniref:C45 family autoproteolytic acyltransferase/hydolase n=1 Tax=Lentisphaera marina TaxID=1111041 RepID=UPI0023656E66|nr:C45 family peptidase [Lentisphaera marina]MDD7984971.1 C45 family autoproteolytic acyltransferase/hydrolase [Lentisphaera marina]